MRIRRSTTPSVSLSPSHNLQQQQQHHLHQSPSSCSSSSSSSCFSSSQHSTISSHSLTSSSNSTSSSSSLSPSRRCEGLDLLVKAVYFVSGSIVGVPYIQKRVIRRRKPALRFNNFVIGSLCKDDQNYCIGNDDEDAVVDCCSNLIQQNQQTTAKTKRIVNNKKKAMISCNNNHSSVIFKRRSKAVPVKYQDSVLQSWKSNSLRRRRSTKA